MEFPGSSRSSTSSTSSRSSSESTGLPALCPPTPELPQRQPDDSVYFIPETPPSNRQSLSTKSTEDNSSGRRESSSFEVMVDNIVEFSEEETENFVNVVKESSPETSALSTTEKAPKNDEDKAGTDSSKEEEDESQVPELKTEAGKGMASQLNRPRRNNIRYSIVAREDPSTTIVLSVNRKNRILSFKEQDKKEIGSAGWKQRLLSFLRDREKKILASDVETWIKKHPWITQKNGVPPPPKPRTSPAANDAVTKTKSSEEKVIASGLQRGTTPAPTVPAKEAVAVSSNIKQNQEISVLDTFYRDEISAFFETKVDDSFDGFYSIDFVEVSLRCPITKQLLTQPCRSIHCKHIRCFDGVQFLKQYKEGLENFCPVCSISVEASDLKLDLLFIEIIEKFKKSTSKLKRVKIYSDLRYEMY